MAAKLAEEEKIKEAQAQLVKHLAEQLAQKNADLEKPSSSSPTQEDSPPTADPPAPPAQAPVITVDEAEDEEKDMTFKEKVAKVCEVLGLEKKYETPKANYAGEEKKEGDTILLPAVGWIEDLFTTYMKELRNEKGQGKNTGSYRILEQWKVPNQFKPPGTFYKVRDEPWLASAADNVTHIIGKPLYPSSVDAGQAHTDLPTIKVKDARLKGWETSNREALGVINLASQFVQATKSILQEILEIAYKPEVSIEDLDQLVYHGKDGNQLLDSVGKALQDLGKGTVDRACSQLLARRDSWLVRMPKIPDGEKRKLRAVELNHPALFDEDTLDKAEKAITSKTEHDLHLQLLKEKSKSTATSSGNGNKTNYTEKRSVPNRGRKDTGRDRETEEPFRKQHSGYNRSDKRTVKPRNDRGGRGGNNNSRRRN